MGSDAGRGVGRDPPAVPTALSAPRAGRGIRVRAGVRARIPVVGLLLVALALLSVGGIVHHGTVGVWHATDRARVAAVRARRTAEGAERQREEIVDDAALVVDHLGAVADGYRQQLANENAVIDAANTAVATHNTGQGVVSDAMGDAQSALGSLELSSTALGVTNAQAQAALAALARATR